MEEKLTALQKIDARQRAINLSVQGILGAAVMSTVGLTGWFTGTFVVSDSVRTMFVYQVYEINASIRGVTIVFLPGEFVSRDFDT